MHLPPCSIHSTPHPSPTPSYHSDRLLLNRTAVASVLIVMHGALNIEKTLWGDLHYHLFYLATAAKPRMLITVDEDMQPIATR
jgi:26S proteasome regulatory subunit N1